MIRLLSYVFLSLALCLVINNTAFASKITIEKPIKKGIPSFSGDKQLQKLGLKLNVPVRFIVRKDDSLPLADYPIHVSVLAMPSGSKGFVIEKKLVYTDRHGIAQTSVTIGDKEGEYQIIATIKSTSSQNYQVYTFYGQSSKWLLYLFVGLIGGMGLFLFGMEVMSRGLQKSAGDKMRYILSRLTKNKFVSVFAGATITMIIQSSSAMAAMLVNFVNTKLMKFRPTIPILIGAAVGTTITAQLIAFKITDYAMIFVGIGAFMYLFISKISVKNIGESILGFGLLFFGLKVMSDSILPLRSYEPFVNLLLSLENPLLGIAAGAIFTALVHSSSACIGIIMIFASQGLISLESGLYLLLGANLGTPATALMVSINTSKESRKVAYAQLIYKIIMVSLFVWFVPPIVSLLNYYSYRDIPVQTADIVANVLPRQIANAHTFINITVAIIVFAFLPLFEKLINRLFPTDEEKPLFKIRYLDNSMLNSPTLALNLAKQEIIRLGKKVHILLDEVILPFLNNDVHSLDDLHEKRDEIKALRDEIKTYILKLSRNADENRVNEAFQLMHVLQELSHINDTLTKILHRRAEKWIDRKYGFSDEAKKEIQSYHESTLRLFKNALDVFQTLNLEKAYELKQARRELAQVADGLERAHYERLLRENAADVNSSKTHLEIVNAMKIISEHSVNIVRIFISRN